MDIKEIIGFLGLYKPKDETFANKSAFLVSSQMNKALVNVYITLSKLLPFTYRVFTELPDAEKFLKEAD